jgi:hypothetical protein
VGVRGKPTDWDKWYSTARWARIRRHQLLEHPLCKYCAERGIVTPATICNHVEPHRGDLYVELHSDQSGWVRLQLVQRVVCCDRQVRSDGHGEFEVTRNCASAGGGSSRAAARCLGTSEAHSEPRFNGPSMRSRFRRPGRRSAKCRTKSSRTRTI